MKYIEIVAQSLLYILLKCSLYMLHHIHANVYVFVFFYVENNKLQLMFVNIK